MLNIIKMDLYRMLKTKSMYVIWIVLAAILLITTSLCKTDYELSTEKDAMKQEQVTEPTVDNINVGMMVTLPTEPGEKVTVYDIFFANSQGKLYALLLVIFTVLFSTADISSGYIKNIGGQVRNRGTLIFSRAIALAVFTVLTMAGAFLFQAAANGIVFGELEWGNTKAILSYFVTELALHYALVLICMAIAIILKNNVISMVIAVCLSMNVMTIVYGDLAVRCSRHCFINIKRKVTVIFLCLERCLAGLMNMPAAYLPSWFSGRFSGITVSCLLILAAGSICCSAFSGGLPQ